jgi:hypothetical protein
MQQLLNDQLNHSVTTAIQSDDILELLAYFLTGNELFATFSNINKQFSTLLASSSTWHYAKFNVVGQDLLQFCSVLTTRYGFTIEPACLVLDIGQFYQIIREHYKFPRISSIFTEKLSTLEIKCAPAVALYHSAYCRLINNVKNISLNNLKSGGLSNLIYSALGYKPLYHLRKDIHLFHHRLHSVQINDCCDLIGLEEIIRLHGKSLRKLALINCRIDSLQLKFQIYCLISKLALNWLDLSENDLFDDEETATIISQIVQGCESLDYFSISRASYSFSAQFIARISAATKERKALRLIINPLQSSDSFI